MTALILLSEWQKSQVEFWRAIPGFPYYDVSSLGRVRGWAVQRPIKGCRGSKTVRGSVPHPIKQRFGRSRRGQYPQVTLWSSHGKAMGMSVHRLVMTAFVPNPEAKRDCNHLNAVKSDSRLGNLAWATQKENMEHAFKHGLFDNVLKRGRDLHFSKLTDAEIGAIRAALAEKKSGSMLRVTFRVD